MKLSTPPVLLLLPQITMRIHVKALSVNRRRIRCTERRHQQQKTNRISVGLKPRGSHHSVVLLWSETDESIPPVKRFHYTRHRYVDWCLSDLIRRWITNGPFDSIVVLQTVISGPHRSGRAAVTIILAIAKGAVKHGAPLLPFVRIKKLLQRLHEGNRLDDGTSGWV